MRRWIFRLIERRSERKLHNDRDFDCVYWWGDRGGCLERCCICNPKEAE